MAPRFGRLAVAATWVVLGCPGPRATPPVKPPAEAEVLRTEVQRLSSQAEALLRTQDELFWRTWTQGARPAVAATYAGHEALFTPESIQKIDRLRRLSKDPKEIRALTYLLAHFVGEYLAAQLQDLTDAIANLEASLTFTLDGKDHRYGELDRLLAQESSATRRRALYQAATPAVQRLSASVRRREEKKTELVAALGYPSYEAFGAELRQADPKRLALLAEEVLSATEEPWSMVLARLGRRELDLPPDQLRRADFPRLFRLKAADAQFPAATQLARAGQTTQGMGIALGELRNLRIDSQDLPQRPERALAVGVEVPGDVRLAHRPVAGVRAQAALLAEVGRALHLCFTGESRFELTKLGDVAVGEAYAVLFEDLVADPIWLEEHAGLSGDKLDEHLSASAAHSLHRIRVTAGRLLYQLELRRRGLQDATAIYGPVMARAYGVPMGPEDEERALVELEDFYQSADNFRAWFLAGQLQAHLKARSGPAWWHNPESVDFLKPLWARGRAATVREVVALIGEERLRPDVLLLRLSTTLKVPMTLPAHFGREAEQPTSP
jgi:hypothetical protein